VRFELLLALEVTALTSFTFARPILEAMGDATSAFVARQVTGTIVVWWALAVILLPSLFFVAIGLSARLAPERVRPATRHVVHCVIVGCLAALAAWRLGVDQTDLDGAAPQLVLMGLVVGAGIGATRWWLKSQDVVAAFLQFAAVAPLVFLGQFVLASETGEWIRTPQNVDTAAADEVAAQLGDDAPPVVVLVLDELPTAALMDGEGGIDAGLYPNIAALAEQSTWYRNHTTVASKTTRAVPSLVSGTYTADGDDPRDRPANLFTMLGESHDLQVNEAMTDLCPPNFCARDTAGTVGTLLSDSRQTWMNGVSDVHPWQLFQLPGLDDDRYARTEDWIADLDLDGADRPPLVYLHMLLPHSPWIYLRDGTRYQDSNPHGTTYFNWGRHGIDNAQRRLIMQAQATDHLVGQVMHELRSADLYDDALVVLTADHGYGFTPGSPLRDLSADNAVDVLWSPLIIKEPGQRDGEVVDDNVELVDVLPAVADVLGVELPWEVDGIPVGERRDETKTVLLGGEDLLYEQQNGDPVYTFDGSDGFEELRETHWLDTTGPEAVWERTEHADLLREPVEQVGVGEPVDGEVDVVDPASWEPVQTDEPLPVVIYGTTELAEGALEEGDVVAFGLNGRVAALAEVAGTSERPVHGLLLPDLYEDGENELSAFVVDGEPGDETLRPLRVTTE
jgi:hypothetical protein